MPYFTVCQHGSLWLTRFWIPSLWGTSITGNLIWDFDWHCLPDLISNLHMEHKVVKCNPCQTQRKSWKNCNKIIKAYNLTKLQMLTPLQSHDEYLYNWYLHFTVARLILTDFICVGVWAHKMPGGGVQNITSYIAASSTLLKIWCLVHPDCKEDDGSFVLRRCNQLWEICQQITASRVATFSL